MFKNKTFLIILGIFILSFFSWKVMLAPGYFSMHDDMQFMRLYEMDKCVKDGQIPCRWVPDLGYGYGYPLFNYYAPLTYYTGEAIHLVFRTGFLDTAKIMFALSFILSGIFMYFFAREFWGKIGGFLAAIFYIYAPYHSTDIYVRGAMAEVWALNWFPLIFLAIYKFIKEEKFKWLVLLAVSYGALLSTHNVMMMLFTGASACWGIAWIVYTRKFKMVWKLALGTLWGVGIAAFFILPVMVEKQYAHTETMVMGYFNYLSHFATVFQLFIETEWGWGASVAPDDKFPYMIGYLHWILPLINLVLAGIFWRKKEHWVKFSALAFGVVFLFGCAFLSHQRSHLIWENVKILEFLQFPWRFLGLVIFFASFSVGSVVCFLKNWKLQVILTAILISVLLFMVKDYFRPEVYYQTKDSDRLTGLKWDRSLNDAIFDYLPIYATYPPPGKAPELPQIIEGEAEVLDLEKGTNWQKFNLNVNSNNAKIQINLYDFPGWEVKVDGQKTFIDHNNYLGLITISVPEGSHQISARLKNTPIRTFGNILTAFSLGLLVFVGIKSIRKRK